MAWVRRLWEPESITREEKNRCSLQERKIDCEFVNNNGFPFWRLSFLLGFFCNTIEYGWKCCTMPFFWFHHEKSWTSTACHSARSAIDNNSLCGGYFPDSIGNMTNLKKKLANKQKFLQSDYSAYTMVSKQSCGSKSWIYYIYGFQLFWPSIWELQQQLAINV